MFDKQPSLESDLVVLRPLNPADFDALYLVASDPEVWTLHPQPGRWRETVFRQLFQASLESGGAMVVIDKRSGTIIGSSRYNVPDHQKEHAEIGWSFLARSYWGGLWNREVKRLLMAHAFKFVDTVYFRVGETNVRSRRAMEKLGARLISKNEVIMIENRPVAHVFYEISKAEFEADLRTAGSP